MRRAIKEFTEYLRPLRGNLKDIGGVTEAYSLGYSVHHYCMRRGQPKRMRGLIMGYDWVNDLKNYRGKKSGDRRKAVAHKHSQGIALFITTDQDLFIPFFYSARTGIFTSCSPAVLDKLYALSAQISLYFFAALTRRILSTFSLSSRLSPKLKRLPLSSPCLKW